ncbi:hypothetical protein Dimus_025496 [Dionaea muscipula]
MRRGSTDIAPAASYTYRRRKFANSNSSRLCIFPKVKSAESSSSSSSRPAGGYVPVYLNVYDLTPINGYVFWAGLGIFHTGIEVHGVEYAFGAHDFPTSGVFEVEPRQCPGFKFRKAIFMGTTCLGPLQVRELMEEESGNSYKGDAYHLIVKNCNHFCDDISYKLTGKHIPRWVNRLARIGSVCSCILPDTLKATKVVRHDQLVPGDLQMLLYDELNERKRLRSSLSCLSSNFSPSPSPPPPVTHQKEVSISSITLRSHYYHLGLREREREIESRSIPPAE